MVKHNRWDVVKCWCSNDGSGVVAMEVCSVSGGVIGIW